MAFLSPQRVTQTLAGKRPFRDVSDQTIHIADFPGLGESF